MNHKKVTWIVVQILLFISLCIFLTSCGNNEKDNEKNKLHAQATAFGDLLIQIQDMDEYDATEKLEKFIEPSSDQQEKIDQYYSEFSATSEKLSIISQSIEDIFIYPNKINADVTYHIVAELPNGKKIPTKQITQWKCIDKIWYRTIKEPRKQFDFD